MTREQAKANLIELGISEPSDEQVTNYLNKVNSETKKEKDRADKLKEKAEKADELQKRLDEIDQENMSEKEKAEKALETANSRIAELEKAQTISTRKADVINKFKVNAEQADKIVKEDGSLDMDVLGQIISEKETAAAEAKEQEIANKSGNPGGGSGGEGGDEKSSAEKIAEKLYGKGDNSENSVLSHYIEN